MLQALGSPPVYEALAGGLALTLAAARWRMANALSEGLRSRSSLNGR